MPEKIALITDSTSDLDADFVQQYGIHVLPLKVVYKDRQYSDRVDITPEEVYATIDKEAPTTSVPTPGDAQALLTKLRAEGFTHVLSMHISSGLSGTTQMVRMVAKDFEDMVIEVVDSKSLSMGLGFVVQQAAYWLEEQKTFAQIAAGVNELVNRTRTFFLVETLEYLKRGGRIGKVQATLGDFLNVKPIISINEEGVYYTHSKVRGRQRSIDGLFKLSQETITGFKEKVRVAVMHGGATEEGAKLFERMKDVANIEDLTTGQIGPVMVVHTGPGLLGIAICPVPEL